MAVHHESEEGSSPSRAVRFHSTQWSQVLRAASPEDPGGPPALAELCRAYWYPLYAYVRRRGQSHSQAEDGCRDVFCLVARKEHPAICGTPDRGRFRGFLVAAMSQFLARQHEYATAAKWCPPGGLISFDAMDADTRYRREPADNGDPDHVFDYTWAVAVVTRAMGRLRAEHEAAGLCVAVRRVSWSPDGPGGVAPWLNWRDNSAWPKGRSGWRCIRLPRSGMPESPQRGRRDTGRRGECRRRVARLAERVEIRPAGNVGSAFRLSSQWSVTPISRAYMHGRGRRVCQARTAHPQFCLSEGECPACLLQLTLDLGGRALGRGPRQDSHPADWTANLPNLEFLEFVGRAACGPGGHGSAEDLDRIVAVKLLDPERRPTRCFASGFFREAQAMARLSHRHIVGIYGVERSASHVYLTMEFVDGRSLRECLATGRCAAEALRLIPQLCDAMQYAHDARAVHRDIKPENVLIDAAGNVKIAGFALSPVCRKANCTC